MAVVVVATGAVSLTFSVAAAVPSLAVL